MVDLSYTGWADRLLELETYNITVAPGDTFQNRTSVSASEQWPGRRVARARMTFSWQQQSIALVEVSGRYGGREREGGRAGGQSRRKKKGSTGRLGLRRTRVKEEARSELKILRDLEI